MLFKNVKKDLAYAVEIAIGYRTVNQFASICKIVDAKPLLDILNEEIKELPTREFLRTVASASEGRITHSHLYYICGYSERDAEENKSWAEWKPERGEIYMVDLGFNMDCEQSGIRPAVVVSNNVGNTHSPSVVIIPITSKRKFSPKIHVHIGKEYGLLEDSYALSEQIKSVSKRRFFYNRVPYKITSLTEEKMLEIQNALEFELGFQPLMFEEDKAFKMIEHIKSLEQNIKIKRSNNLLDILDEKIKQFTDYCSKYHRSCHQVITKYNEVNYIYESV